MQKLGQLYTDLGDTVCFYSITSPSTTIDIQRCSRNRSL
jgi:hypothetical protein